MRRFASLPVFGFLIVASLVRAQSAAPPAASPATPTSPAAAVTPTAPAAPTPAKLTGYVQARETIANHTGVSGTINRARLAGEGSLPSRFSYKVLVEYESGGNSRTAATVALRDAYVKWTYAPYAITAGQYKTPFSREYITSITAIETPDRATVVDSLAPKRDIGVMAEVVQPSYGLWIGGFNGEGQNVPANRDSVMLWVARAHVRPIPEVTLGGNVARYSADSTRYGGDLSIERGGALLRGEMIGQHSRFRTRDDLGWFALAAYRVLPWLQLVMKQEDFQRPAIGVRRRMMGTSGGANLDFPGGRTRLAIFFIGRRNGEPGNHANGLVTQLQAKF